jgi:hypothetical protein
MADPFAGLPAIFRECVAPYTVRYDLTRPWVAGDHVYATDGRILVRVPVAGLAPGTLGPLWNAAAMFDRHPGRYAEPIVLPEPGGPESTPCAICKGGGQLECDARGAYGPGAGPLAFECPVCDGSGRVINWESTPVADGYALSARFVHLLRRHGAAVHLPLAPDGSTPSDVPAYFVAGPVEGLVMPCVSPARSASPWRKYAEEGA